MRQPAERQQVMHAQRVERDRLRDDQPLVAVLVRERRRPEGRRREQLRVGLGNAARGLAQAVGADVGAERAQQVADGVLQRLVVDPSRQGVAVVDEGEPRLGRRGGIAPVRTGRASAAGRRPAPAAPA